MRRGANVQANVIPCSYSHVNSVVLELTRCTLQSQHMLLAAG